MKEIETIQEILFEALIEIDAILTTNRIPYWIDFGTLLGAVRGKNFIPWDDDIDLCIEDRHMNEVSLLLKDNLPMKYRVTYGGPNSTIIVPIKIEILNVRTIERELFERDVDETKHPCLSIDIFNVTGRKTNGGAAWKYILRFFAKLRAHITISMMLKNQHLKFDWKSMLRSLLRVQIIKKSVFMISGIILNPANGNSRFFIRGVDSIFAGQSFPSDVIFPLGTIDFHGRKFPTPFKPDHYLKTVYGNDYSILPQIDLRRGHATKYIFSEVFE